MMEESIAYLKDFIEGRIDMLREEHPVSNRMKCFHDGQIDAFREILDEIEEMEGDE
ncbi:MAG: hypothetical protein ACI4W2_12600 [Eubacterium sp.]